MRDVHLPYAGLRGAREALKRGLPEVAAEALRSDESLIADECLSLLRDGLQQDAATRLDRWLRPKWHSEAQCASAYRKTMEARS
jgi:hypothetical protein